MTAATYDNLLPLRDPTESYTFRVGLIVDRAVARIRRRFVVEVAKLLFLGFYDELQSFLEAIALAEDNSRTEAEYKALWERKQRVALKTGELIEHLTRLEKVDYRGTTLLRYIAGAHRLEELRLFVRATNLEERGEAILSQAKTDFLNAFGKRQLTRNQTSALLEKHKELAQTFSATTKSTS